ncbi:MAG: glycosyltransferase family 4 protein, partial [Dehalococcoidia bacterium]|nr:glycosyltransferase family 4 protein [Dehalococcoidia bacterium]
QTTGRASRPLDILILGGLVPWHPPGGGSQVVPFELADALAKAGHHVDYVAVAPGSTGREMKHAHPLYISMEPGSPAFPNGLLFPLYQYLKTRRMLREYDVIHCDAHNAAFYALHKTMLGSDQTLAVTIYTSGIPRHFWQRRSFFEPYLFLALKLADLVVCPSDYSRANVSVAYGIPLSKTRPLHGGVPSSFLGRNTCRDAKRTSTLLFCGRLNGPRPFKTLDILLTAMPRILRRHSVELRIIGTGPRLEEYAALARKLGIEEEVHFLGFVDPSEMGAHYGRADLFVLPSRMENFPLVILEAMASGLPVVATDVGGVPELVEHGETGLLVPPNDPDALADAINDLLDDPDEMEQMGARGRQLVSDQYTWDRVAERIAGYLRDML